LETGQGDGIKCPPVIGEGDKKVLATLTFNFTICPNTNKSIGGV